MKPKVVLDPLFGEIVDPEGTFLDDLKKEPEPVTEVTPIFDTTSIPETEPDYPGTIEMPKELLDKLRESPKLNHINLGFADINTCSCAITFLPIRKLF